MKTLKIAVIRNLSDYNEALTRVNQIYDADPGSDGFYELKILTQQIEEFENEKFPIPDADPIEIIEFILDQNGLKHSDLVGIMGEKTTVSEEKEVRGSYRSKRSRSVIPFMVLIFIVFNSFIANSRLGV